MRQFPKPRLVISRCIEFDDCRWNGVRVTSDVVKLLKPFVEFVAICPEIGIGLGIPREPVRVIATKGERRLIQPATNKDMTEAMEDFARASLANLQDVDGFILKSRSPSCGARDVKIYPSSDHNIPSRKGAGMFAQAAMELFPNAPVEDEGRLTDYNIRHDFLTRIFTLAAFRQVKASGQMSALVQFQAENKYLLMAYSQELARAMGASVANQEQQDWEQVIQAYEAHLIKALSEPPSLKSSINVLMHALGYFSNKLSREERAFFLETVQDYRNRRAPISVCTSILRSWITRFGEDYLRQQTFFAPYPVELIQVTDSGKGREV
jgi:uncharacterized protein YbgA (DUF1722 family)/uncharacterized protein YbbK (DUF523 family)